MKPNTRYQFIANKLGILMKLQIWMAEETSWGNILNAYEAPNLAPQNHSAVLMKTFEEALLMMMWAELAVILHKIKDFISLIKVSLTRHMKRRGLPPSRVVS